MNGTQKTIVSLVTLTVILVLGLLAIRTLGPQPTTPTIPTTCTFPNGTVLDRGTSLIVGDSVMVCPEEGNPWLEQVATEPDCPSCEATPEPTLIPEIVTQPPANTEPTPAPTETCPPNDGVCWSYNHSTQTMTWTGTQDGMADIHQGDATSLSLIRAGWTAIFTTTVPGELIMTIGNIDGQKISTPSRVTLEPGRHVVTASVGESGGFRWTPEQGYGWRK